MKVLSFMLLFSLSNSVAMSQVTKISIMAFEYRDFQKKKKGTYHEDRLVNVISYDLDTFTNSYCSKSYTKSSLSLPVKDTTWSNNRKSKNKSYKYCFSVDSIALFDSAFSSSNRTYYGSFTRTSHYTFYYEITLYTKTDTIEYIKFWERDSTGYQSKNRPWQLRYSSDYYYPQLDRFLIKILPPKFYKKEEMLRLSAIQH